MKQHTAFLIGAMLIAGCGTNLKVTKLNSPPKPLSPKTPDSIEVFTTGRPTVPYTDVSLISAQQASAGSTDGTPEIIQKMRDEAARQGCDALIITMPNDNVVGATGGTSGGVYGQVNTMKGFHGTCVVYNK